MDMLREILLSFDVGYPNPKASDNKFIISFASNVWPFALDSLGLPTAFKETSFQGIWVVVKIMVPLWVP